MKTLKGFKKKVDRAATQVMMKTGRQTAQSRGELVAKIYLQDRWRRQTIATLRLSSDGTAQWRRQRRSYRRKQKAIWTHYEVLLNHHECATSAGTH